MSRIRATLGLLVHTDAVKLAANPGCHYLESDAVSRCQEELPMAPSQSDKAGRFRALHERSGALVMPNPWDGGSARILTALGFEALATTSAGLAFALGRRDGEGALTRDEALANAAAIVQATSLPVSGDLENGFGAAPEAAAEAIRLAAAAGLVGASIEDATGDPDRPIYDASFAAERLAAAAEAARALPFPFTLTGRAENFIYGRPDLETPSAGCRHSRPPARKCSTRRGCAI
jgi:2-methylisocitrate lyase-like PEP mutase family enzyme